ncbi:hypothetical protein RQL81_16305 [Citrobacter braakii]|jgi:hypothetical protein|uniref:hypothetical protein n=1 Tax=Citrobacter TaxID=544 RepID=UPI000CDD2319|nr:MULTISPECIES: hypothetical protein [Citrobacter]MCI1670105.1 hypothetical protein [Citrobacter freundii]MBP8542544.1 hypothetical protein [Citrobacter sp. On2M]MBW5273291.1 hypothetical protein [Citrobacter sp. On28M]MCI1826696.1 hypothetical protein [Citrobacter freundii]MDT7116104.1 hypothetical protein [Citrobacter braakii]
MKRMLFVLMLPITVFAAKVPDFQCWDISNIGSTTADDRYVTRYLDKMPPPGGAYHYETAPNDDIYREVIIVNEQHSDGYYYGNEYMDKKGVMYIDIKCKRTLQ